MENFKEIAAVVLVNLIFALRAALLVVNNLCC